MGWSVGALAACAGDCQHARMDVDVAHFVDAGEQDADGHYDYYEGDTYTFISNGERIQVRTYVDDHSTAFFVGLTCAQATKSALAVEAARYLASAGRTVFRCLGSAGTYEAWTPRR